MKDIIIDACEQLDGKGLVNEKRSDENKEEQELRANETTIHCWWGCGKCGQCALASFIHLWLYASEEQGHLSWSISNVDMDGKKSLSLVETEIMAMRNSSTAHQRKEFVLVLSINKMREHTGKIFFEIRSRLSVHWSFSQRTRHDVFVDDGCFSCLSRLFMWCLCHAHINRGDTWLSDWWRYHRQGYRRNTLLTRSSSLSDGVQTHTRVPCSLCLNNRWSLPLLLVLFFWWVLTSSTHQKSTPFLCIL